MSTNYYMNTKDIELAGKLMPRVEFCNDDKKGPFFEIHLCQFFGNLEVSLESHSYKDWKGLKEILSDSKNSFWIENEYGTECDVSEFIRMVESHKYGGKEILQRTENGISVVQKYPNHFRYDDEGYLFSDEDFC